VLDNTSLERFASNNHSLFATFVSFEENEVFRMWLQGPYTQCLIFIVNYELARLLHYNQFGKVCYSQPLLLIGPSHQLQRK
jgi:hypothetical protein